MGLPHQIAYGFIDPQTSARLSQIKFSEGITSLKLQLKLYLPKNPSEEVKIDKPIEFYTLCLDEEESIKLEARRLRPEAGIQMAKGPNDQIAILKDIKGGKVRLEIIPRGIGRIEVEALNLYHEIKVGEAVEMDVNVKNTGTRRLDNIRVYTDLPLNWRAEIEPDLIQSLEQDKDKLVKIRFLPPVDVSVEDYEPKIKTECTSFGRRIESEDKIVRIHILSKTNILGITVLITLLISLLVGIVVFGIKLTRR